MYGQLFKNSAVRQESSTATESGAVEILPNGETLDFSKAIFKDRFKYNQVQYPKLNPGSDVGIPKPSLIVP